MGHMVLPLTDFNCQNLCKFIYKLSEHVTPTLLVAGVLRTFSTCATASSEGTYTVSFLVKHEGGDGATGVSMVTGLTANSDSGTAPAILILGARNGVGQRRHSSDG